MYQTAMATIMNGDIWEKGGIENLDLNIDIIFVLL